MRKRYKAIGAWSLAAVLTFAALELTCRVYAKLAGIKLRPIPSTFKESFPEHTYFTFDRELGFKLIPKWESPKAQITAEGHRSSTTIPPTQDKILILGDSMVYGVGVPQPELFTEILNQKKGDFYFINAGVTGYSTKQELIVARHLLPRYKPKFTFLFFTQANDIWWNNRDDGFQPPLRRDDDGNLFFSETKEVQSVPLYKKTALYLLLSKLVLRGKDVPYFLQRLDFALRGRSSEVWVMTRQILLAMDGMARHHGSKLVVVDIPSDFPVVEGARSIFGGSRAREDRLSETCKENAIEYVNLRDVYPADASQSLFLPGDSHWNPRGHGFIANWVSGYLDRQRKVASPPSTKR